MKRLILSGLHKAKNLLDLMESSLKVEPVQLDSPKNETVQQQAERVSDPPLVEQGVLPGLAAPEASTTEDRRPMNDLLRKWARVSGHTYKELKAKVRAYAGVTRIDLMTKGQVKDTCIWIEGHIKASTKTKQIPLPK